MAALTATLDGWLDANSDYPQSARGVTIELIDQARVATLQGVSTRSGSHTRGLYDPETATIYLVRPWAPTKASDAAVLLHELVHHRQKDAHHWYCAGAQEPDAYRLQERWLAERGINLRINRIAVVLGAGCTPRDFHPD